MTWTRDNGVYRNGHWLVKEVYVKEWLGFGWGVFYRGALESTHHLLRGAKKYAEGNLFRGLPVISADRIAELAALGIELSARAIVRESRADSSGYSADVEILDGTGQPHRPDAGQGPARPFLAGP